MVCYTKWGKYISQISPSVTHADRQWARRRRTSRLYVNSQFHSQVPVKLKEYIKNKQNKKLHSNTRLLEFQVKYVLPDWQLRTCPHLVTTTAITSNSHSYFGIVSTSYSTIAGTRQIEFRGNCALLLWYKKNDKWLASMCTSYSSNAMCSSSQLLYSPQSTHGWLDSNFILVQTTARYAIYYIGTLELERDTKIPFASCMHVFAVFS